MIIAVSASAMRIIPSHTAAEIITPTITASKEPQVGFAFIIVAVTQFSKTDVCKQPSSKCLFSFDLNIETGKEDTHYKISKTLNQLFLLIGLFLQIKNNFFLALNN